jgi:CYTH domain-containing protein
MIEHERKYLFSGNTMPDGETVSIKQGYLMLSRRQQLRVRIINNNAAFLCYKADRHEGVRDEYEYEIPLKDGAVLYSSAKYQIEKARISTEFRGNHIDIDAYANGLIIVEVEISDPGAPLLLPTYCGQDVTGFDRYTNIALAKLNQ